MFAQVTAVGRCTRDVKYRILPSETAVAEVSIAVNRRRKRGEAWVDETTYVDVVAYAWLADRLRDKGSKGARLLVSGDLRQEFWQGKDGSQRSRLRVVAHAIHTLDYKAKADDAPGETTPGTPEPELPF